MAFSAAALLLLPLRSLSQVINCGSIKYLYSTNGFKNIVLGADMNLLQGKLTYLDDDTRPDADSCMRYEYSNEDLLSIDSTLKLDMIGIRTYKNKIVNIYLFFNQKDAYKVLSNFLRNYGQYTDKPIEYADIYYWKTKNVDLSLTYTPDVDKGVAVFTYKPLIQNIMVDDQLRRIRTEMATLQANNVQ